MPAPWPTPRLAFREMAPDDLDDMAALLGDPQVMRYYPRPKSRQEASAWIAWNQRLYRDHDIGLWLLRLRETSEFVGDCGLTPQQVDGLTEIEIGYHIRSALQGRGLATEAAAACRDHARDVLGLERLIAIVDPRNRPSRGSPRSSGWWSSATATTMADGAAPAASTPCLWLGHREWRRLELAVRSRWIKSRGGRGRRRPGAVPAQDAVGRRVLP